MQAAARTPSSVRLGPELAERQPGDAHTVALRPVQILKRRINKENEDATGRLNKRTKLSNRRVSFAPDDELETKHIFKKVKPRGWKWYVTIIRITF